MSDMTQEAVEERKAEEEDFEDEIPSGDGEENVLEKAASEGKPGFLHFIIVRKWVISTIMFAFVSFFLIVYQFLFINISSEKAALPAHPERPSLLSEAIPFFVPLPPGSSNVAVRVDLLLRTDRTTGIRLKRDAPQIRMEVYGLLLKMAQEEENFIRNTESMEGQIGKIVGHLLGGNVEVTIKAVKVI